MDLDHAVLIGSAVFVILAFFRFLHAEDEAWALFSAALASVLVVLGVLA